MQGDDEVVIRKSSRKEAVSGSAMSRSVRVMSDLETLFIAL